LATLIGVAPTYSSFAGKCLIYIEPQRHLFPNILSRILPPAIRMKAQNKKFKIKSSETKNHSILLWCKNCVYHIRENKQSAKYPQPNLIWLFGFFWWETTASAQATPQIHLGNRGVNKNGTTYHIGANTGTCTPLSVLPRPCIAFYALKAYLFHLYQLRAARTVKTIQMKVRSYCLK